MDYLFLQQYWWFLVSLLGALFVVLTFVQGANSMIFSLGRTEEERQLIVNSTGRKWEFTFTTLVTFGGAFFASFPLFYSTSFGGAYWVWMLILFTFVLQAVAYEFQSKPGNVFGQNTYRWFLVFNGLFGPFLVGVAVGTFFHGAEFVVSKDEMGLGGIISRWATPWHGLEALLNLWNWVLGAAVLFLSRTLGILYIINNVEDEDLRAYAVVRLWREAVPFVLLFVAFVVHLLFADGWAVGEQGIIAIEEYKYLHNLLEMPLVAGGFLVGVVAVLSGIGASLWAKSAKGIWSAGVGTILTVLCLLLLAGWNNTCYYPSLADMQSSLHLANSCSSEFTLKVMAYVSGLIPLVLAYIFWAWRSIDQKGLTRDELHHSEHKY